MVSRGAGSLRRGSGSSPCSVGVMVDWEEVQKGICGQYGDGRLRGGAGRIQ